jgi:hypothetical protein
MRYLSIEESAQIAGLNISELLKRAKSGKIALYLDIEPPLKACDPTLPQDVVTYGRWYNGDYPNTVSETCPIWMRERYKLPLSQISERLDRDWFIDKLMVNKDPFNHDSELFEANLTIPLTVPANLLISIRESDVNSLLLDLSSSNVASSVNQLIKKRKPIDDERIDFLKEWMKGNNIASEGHRLRKKDIMDALKAINPDLFLGSDFTSFWTKVRQNGIVKFSRGAPYKQVN